MPQDAAPWEEKLKGKRIVEGEIQERDEKTVSLISRLCWVKIEC